MNIFASYFNVFKIIFCCFHCDSAYVRDKSKKKQGKKKVLTHLLSDTKL